jgi:hypothetical protein
MFVKEHSCEILKFLYIPFQKIEPKLKFSIGTCRSNTKIESVGTHRKVLSQGTLESPSAHHSKDIAKVKAFNK